jgi:hypothetical protein
LPINSLNPVKLSFLSEDNTIGFVYIYILEKW